MTRRIDPTHPARNERMADMYRQGVTLEKIGAQFEVTRERVRQILAALGVASSEGGKRLQRVILGGTKRDRAIAEKRRIQELRTGVPYELFSALRAEGHVKAFLSHKKSAASRGIAFDLTLGQWWAVWQASGHAHQRGRGKGKFCMSRMSDAGGYVLGNIHIQPCVENSRDAVKTWQGKPAKEHPGVFLLYPGLSKPYMAKVGKKVLGYFATAEQGTEARKQYAESNGIALHSHGVGGGRGWTFLKFRSKPYYMQGPGGVNSSHVTQEEAEAAYAAACAAYNDSKRKVAANA